MMFDIYENCAMKVSTAMKQEEKNAIRDKIYELSIGETTQHGEHDLTETFSEIRSDNDPQKILRFYQIIANFLNKPCLERYSS